MKKKQRILVGDFETTVYEGQEKTEVWASAIAELYSDDVEVFHSIEETFDYLVSLDENILIYYHNLKFDGAFWIDFLLRVLKYKQAYWQEGDYTSIRWKKKKEMKSKEFQYLISDNGQFYSILIKKGRNFIEIRDSYKLIPFSVKEIGRSFETTHKKSQIEYTGYRYAGCEITPEEVEYIKNDVLVIKEALEIMYDEGHDKLTIGSCCLAEFKEGAFNGFPGDRYRDILPNMKEITLNPDEYGYENADEYIRKSYKGGWCYVNPKFQGQVIDGGVTLDVNSLYPSMMSGASNNIYPIGKPIFWKGERPKETYKENTYFFIRFRAKFKIKPNHLPFVQVKNSFMYSRNACLTTSNYIDKNGKEWEYYEKDGKVEPCLVTLTLTCTDYFLFLDHYDVEYIECLDGCYFPETIHAGLLFDRYIEKYKKIKMESKGGKRTLAKLYLNNLYGKLATADNSSFKVAYIDDETDAVKFYTVAAYEKSVVYIPIGSAITSYAREFTIRTAQKNYNRFIYADTDSIHCKGKLENIKGVKLHDNEFLHWKHESTWDEGYFTRQKTYIEHIIDVEEPHYDIKCAGMPERCKKLFIRSLTNDLAKDDEELHPEERKFLSKKRELTDFDIGLKIYGKLVPKRIPGGIVLIEDYYTMRG